VFHTARSDPAISSRNTPHHVTQSGISNIPRRKTWPRLLLSSMFCRRRTWPRNKRRAALACVRDRSFQPRSVPIHFAATSFRKGRGQRGRRAADEKRPFLFSRRIFRHTDESRYGRGDVAVRFCLVLAQSRSFFLFSLSLSLSLSPPPPPFLQIHVRGARVRVPRKSMD